MWLAIARILAVFDIPNIRDSEGQLVNYEVKFINAMTRCVSEPVGIEDLRANIIYLLQPP